MTTVRDMLLFSLLFCFSFAVTNVLYAQFMRYLDRKRERKHLDECKERDEVEKRLERRLESVKIDYRNDMYSARQRIADIERRFMELCDKKNERPWNETTPTSRDETLDNKPAFARRGGDEIGPAVSTQKTTH